MTTPDHASFLAEIAARPHDDAPRLMFADWLEERGEGERAEFIRVQCELDGQTHEYCSDDYCVMTQGKCRIAALRRREVELLAIEGPPLLGTKSRQRNGTWTTLAYRWAPAPVLLCDWWEFWRGFISSITLPCTVFLTEAAAIIEAVPMLEKVILPDLYIYPVDGEPAGQRVYIRHLPRGATGYSTPLEIYDCVECQDVQPVHGRPGWKRFPDRALAEAAISAAALAYAHDQLARRRSSQL